MISYSHIERWDWRWHEEIGGKGRENKDQKISEN